jgi:type II secretion system protein C
MSYANNLVEGLSRRGMAPQRLIRGAEVLLVIGVAVALASLARDLVTGTAAPAPEAIIGSAPGTAPAGDAGAAALRQVSPALKALFGTPAQGTAGAADEPVRETRLNLTLKGVLTQRDSDKKLALISRGSQKEEVYQVGDQVEGAEIIRIEPRRVIIRRDGVTEALTLEIRVPAGTNTAAPASNVEPRGNSGVRLVGENERAVSRGTFRQQMSNLPRLLQQATAVPHTENGRPAGFRVVDIQAGSIFQDLGIEQNDIIRSVNGISVRTPEEAMNAYRNLRTASRFRLDLVRGGREISIDYTVQ